MTDILIREQTLTAEEFWDRYAGKDGRIELVDGKVVEMAPVGPIHGRVDIDLGSILAIHVKRNRLGALHSNTGFILQRNPDIVRGPDQAFVSAAQIAAHPPPERGFWELAPDLVVEIVSPDDTPKELSAKVEEYLGFGVRTVWVVDPKKRQVEVYRAGERVEIIESDGTLDGGDVLPGLQLPLAEIWG